MFLNSFVVMVILYFYCTYEMFCCYTFNKTSTVMLFAAQSKPKIQRIVWEDDRNVTASASPSSGNVVQGTVIPLLPGSSEHMLQAHGSGPSRGFSRPPMQVYRGQPRHAARPMMQPSVMRQRAPGGVQANRQVARRARGRSPGVPRQRFY